MENLEKIKVLGKGSFGDVLLVKNKIDNNLYALKRVSLDNDK